MKIRKATVKEATEITELWKRFMKEHETMEIKRNKKVAYFVKKLKTGHVLFKKYLISTIKSKKSVVFVAEEKGKIRGYLLATIKSNIPIFSIGKMGYINDLYIEKGYRKKGLSTKFKNAALKWMRKRGMKMAAIEVSPMNSRARRIYKHWGFEELRIDMRKKL